ncbi:hypothetical protein KFU94_34820 [Chloroflexi bacterium TSY]|nr:hypothetical protein [Chloroflexi bacterium TSY]
MLGFNLEPIRKAVMSPTSFSGEHASPQNVPDKHLLSIHKFPLLIHLKSILPMRHLAGRKGFLQSMPVRIITWSSLLCVLILLTEGCGRDRSHTTSIEEEPGLLDKAPAGKGEASTQNTNSSPFPSATTVITPSIPQVDTEFLDGILPSACDHPEDVSMLCHVEPHYVKLGVDIHASTFARWSLRWQDTNSQSSSPTDSYLALTGTETLYLRARRVGAVNPNLYLVERDGDRIPIRLSKYGLQEEWSELYIPLAEIQDEEGRSPDFMSLQELQIVFEWADMTGEVEIESVKFKSVWREPVQVDEESLKMLKALGLPTGFRAEVIATDVRAITQINFIPSGDLLLSLQNGRVWWYTDHDADGRYDERHLYTAGLSEVVGLLYDPVDGSVWLGGRGQLYRTLDRSMNGVADQYDLRIDGLPWGRHQNNGLVWNPDPDPFTGEAGGRWIYFGLGSTEDLDVGGSLNAAILRFPRDGQGLESLEIVSRGNRNPYMLVWADLAHETENGASVATWQLFASENGPDFNNAPDEVNHIRWQHHYGFPERFGPSANDTSNAANTDELSQIDGLPYSGSLYAVTPHASASGLAYIDHPTWPAEYRTLYVSLFGQVFSEEIVGHTVERIVLIPETTASGPTFRGEPSTFIDGLDRPLPMATGPNGNLIVGDYATGIVYRVWYEEE